jgi:DegV family protein with EDD domain
MPGIAVVADSACDLGTSLVEERHLRLVPLSVRFGHEELIDREQLSTKEFWDRVSHEPELPQTAAPAPGRFQQAFLDAAERGNDGVLCITLSSDLSATYQAARTAAEAVADRIPVRVLDSRLVSLGEGLVVLAAADAADAGGSLDDVVEAAEHTRQRTRVYGVVGSLDFLKRGGRIGGAAHLVGSLLAIKPVIELRDGRVEVESRQRTRARSLQYLAAKATEAGPLRRLAVANGAADDLQDLLDQLAGAPPDHELLLGDLGPVVAAHAGPGTLAICMERA